MRIKYNFDISDFEEQQDILNYYTLGANLFDATKASCGLLIAKSMTKKMKQNMFITLSGSTTHYYDIRLLNTKSLINFNAPDEILHLLQDEYYIAGDPGYVVFSFRSTISEICRCFEAFMAYAGKNDCDFLFGIYDSKRLYKHGRFSMLSNYFDCVFDAKQCLPVLGRQVRTQRMFDYVVYAIHFHNDSIDIYSGDNAKNKFRDYFQETYHKKSGYFYKVKDERNNDFIHQAAKVRLSNFVKEAPIFTEGKDFLKIDFVNDRLSIVFNLSVEDKEDVFSFKRFIQSSIYNASCLSGGELDKNCIEISGLFLHRKFDIENTRFNELLFAEREETRRLESTYKYYLYVQSFKEKAAWHLSVSSFENEFKKFKRLMKKDEYKQINETSLQSLKCRNNFSFGNGEMCGYFVYTY